MDIDDAMRTIGQRVRQIRYARGKSLRVIAGLAGISTSHLSRIERGERALDSRSLIAALAHALQIPPSELMKLPVPAPGNGHTDSSIEAVRLALMAVSHRLPGGQLASVQALRARVETVLAAGRQCRQAEVGSLLPGLIRDLHTSIAAGRDLAELLDLAVMLHVQSAQHWLREVAAPLDLRRENVMLTRQVAEQRGTPTALGLAAYGAMRVLLTAGALDLAKAELAAVDVPTTTPESTQLAGMLALSHSLVAAADSHPADVDAAVEYAGELAQRTGEGTAYGLGFGPTNVVLWRMEAVLEIGDHERVIALAEGLNPEVHPYRSRRSAYWADYGRALTRVRGRRKDAVMAFRRAETIHPHRVQRNPIVRDTLAELLARSRQDAVGRELRGMAYRAGLPV
ncbi:MAG: helix-turn-helix domain-containing protein [Actinomycetota bacterium]|nr:helix-turn-helix domain-containing protein [Actinomycetota bacterium]